MLSEVMNRRVIGVLDLAGFQDRRRGPYAKECRQLLNVGKDNEISFPLKLPKGNIAWLTP